jgi:putative hydrolase of the HAD superfamily
MPFSKRSPLFLLQFFQGQRQTRFPIVSLSGGTGLLNCTFRQVGAFEQFADFTEFFDELYQHFATAEPWFIYPDVLPALEQWRRIGIQLGIVSNFDSRLNHVLDALKLREFFTSITISTQIGVAKPDPQIFTAALEKHYCDAQDAWHIGDSFRQDYQGARSAGLRAILIERTSQIPGEL